MPYICKDCGNDDTFDGTETRKEWNTYNAKFDREGSIDDTGDCVDTTDSEYEDSEVNECGECNGSNIVWKDEEEITEIKKEIELNKTTNPEQLQELLKTGKITFQEYVKRTVNK